MRGRRALLKIIPILLAVAMVFTACAEIESALSEIETSAGLETSAEAPDGGVTVSFLDVGQGDAILLSFPDGTFGLIDAGTADSRDTLMSDLEKAGVKKLAFAVATHPHADHIGGMNRVLTDIEVDKYYMSDFASDTKTFNTILDTLEEKNIETICPAVGEKLYDAGGVALTCVYNGDGAEDANNSSIVLRLTVGSDAAMFMGDLESDCEEKILESGQNVEANLIKLGHHGSSTSSSYAFLDAVAPKYCIISCGVDNSYGHPHAETLTKIKQYKMTAYRTDEQGTITASSDGNGWTFATQK